jgi:MFS family permease
MTATDQDRLATTSRPALRRRLRPLFVAVVLQGVALWVPIQKLFLTGIGFDAASIGVMAAVYAIAVPLFEVPSGVLADRWSRRGVLMLAVLAAAVSVIIGGSSGNVTSYLVSAIFLGLYFAMQSGTFDSLVYDTVLAETGSSNDFERTIGRLRLVESLALMSSALVGAGIAQVAPLQLTYFLTVLPLAGAGFALWRFREPGLHTGTETQSLRRQVATAYRTLARPGQLRLVVALMIIAAVLTQAMLEFGPLWLIWLTVPAIVYGPHWAGLTAALGAGGVLGFQTWLTRRPVVVIMAGAVVAACVTLTLARSVVFVVGAQILLVLVLVAASIPATRLLHDAVPSTARASVASGVGALTWLSFVPAALIIGLVSDRAGVSNVGWLLIGLAALAGILIIAVVPRAASTEAIAVAERVAPSAEDR